MPPTQAQMGQPQLPWEKAVTITCECGNRYFKEAYLLKKFPKTTIEMPGEMRFPEDQIVPVAVLTCTACGKVQEDLLPPALKEVL